MISLEEVLKVAKVAGASDVHLTVGLPPKMRVNGDLINMDFQKMLPPDTAAVAEEIMNEIVSACIELDNVEKAEYRGVSEFANSSINYRLVAHSLKGERAQAKRDIHRAALTVMEKHHVSVPYPQLDVHQK